MSRKCRECGSPIASSASTGRPPTYCDAVCRRAAEYALRRAQVLLTRAQRAEQDAGLATALGRSWDKAELTKVCDYWSGEIERLRGEIRSMLAGVASQSESLGTVEPRT